VTFNFLTNARFDRIFSPSFSGNKTVANDVRGGYYSMYDGFRYSPAPDPRRSQASQEFLSTTSEEYRQSKGLSVGISGDFGKMSGSLVASINNEVETLDTTANYEISSYMYATEHSLMLDVSPGSDLNLRNTAFHSFVEDLPRHYDKTNVENHCKFMEFFDKDVGTHITTQCMIGGVTRQQTAVEDTFHRSQSTNTIALEANIQLSISADARYEETNQNTIEFATQTTFKQMTNSGGEFPEDPSNGGDYNWDRWFNTIANHTNLQCIGSGSDSRFQKSETVDWALDKFPSQFDNAFDKRDAIREAMAQYVNRPGCTRRNYPQFEEDQQLYWMRKGGFVGPLKEESGSCVEAEWYVGFNQTQNCDAVCAQEGMTCGQAYFHDSEMQTLDFFQRNNPHNAHSWECDGRWHQCTPGMRLGNGDSAGNCDAAPFLYRPSGTNTCYYNTRDVASSCSARSPIPNNSRPHTRRFCPCYRAKEAAQ